MLVLTSGPERISARKSLRWIESEPLHGREMELKYRKRLREACRCCQVIWGPRDGLDRSKPDPDESSW